MEQIQSESGILMEDIMREILFRGKRASDKKWIEGGIVALDSDSDFIFISEPYYHASTLPVRELIYDHAHLVDKETVCQYTGLTDKNGKKIFEGDVIRISISEYGINGVYRVIFSEEDYEWEIEREGGFWHVYFSLSKVSRHREAVEVIGNIFDNHDFMDYKKGAGA